MATAQQNMTPRLMQTVQDRALGTVLRRLLEALLLAVLVAGAFYAGMVYQNNQDQSLFTSYHPPTPSGGSGGSSRGGVTQAVQSVGKPPLTPGAGASPTVRPGQQQELVGRWVSSAGGTLSVTTVQGTRVSLPVTADTRFYQVQTGTRAMLEAGRRVTLALGPAAASQPSVTTITILPAGAPLIQVRALGGAGSGGQSVPPGGSRTGGASGGPGLGATAPQAPNGTIIALTGSTISVKTAQGTTHAYTLATTTAIYRVIPVTVTQFWAGSLTTVREATVNGRTVASAAVQSTVNGAVTTYLQ